MAEGLLISILGLLPLLPSAATINGCGGTVDTREHHSGFLTSPGYPDHYPEDTTCTWFIQAPLHEKIRIEFHDFDVTGSVGCHGDYVSISSPSSKQQEKVKHRVKAEEPKGDEVRYCGAKGPDIITSKGDTLVVTFVSNAKGSCRGFNATYSVREEWVTCGSFTQAQEFTFSSPDYPASLPADPLQCSITVDHGCDSPICQLRLDFDEFLLQPPYWGECKYDRFYAESATPLPFLCGVNNGSHMYVNVEGRGKTELTFMLQELEYYLYHCYDLYGSISNEEKLKDEEESDENVQVEAPKNRKKRESGDFRQEDSNVDYTDPENNVGREALQEERIIRQAPSTAASSAAPTTTTTTTTTSSTSTTTTEGDVTVALYNYKDAKVVSFPTRRAWRIKVTQIPCECPKARVPQAPVGCLQYYQGITDEFKSFNFDGVGCYSEDRWCDFSTISHASDCDIRVGYTGHFNNLDYSICVEPESGFCGIQYQQIDRNGFSLTNVTHFKNEDASSLAEERL
ncbi:neuropilin-2-like [Eriocheir sinensis]|uniref:neuropilin-2-like n=1 Tax=Eriocheir sinensis TaxID=95602 RepID=UPI0021C62140|nr:neuropilin-2-like [Eriocheir sinensis]